jgi:hypothetical protein
LKEAVDLSSDRLVMMTFHVIASLGEIRNQEHAICFVKIEGESAAFLFWVEINLYSRVYSENRCYFKRKKKLANT